MINPGQDWIYDSNKNMVTFEEIKLRKSERNPSELFTSQKSKMLIPILEEAYCLGYDEKPNYGKLRFLLE